YAVNTLPGAEFDNSFRDRVLPIPFDQSFYSRDSVNYRDGDLEPDRSLDDKLKAELPGILALLVKGYQLWQEDGALGEPDEVRALSSTYAEENDHVGLWIGERCEKTVVGQTRVGDLFANYRKYC